MDKAQDRPFLGQSPTSEQCGESCYIEGALHEPFYDTDSSLTYAPWCDDVYVKRFR